MALGISAGEESLSLYRAQMGLEQSAFTRYWQWFTHLLAGDFGLSRTYHSPIKEIIAQRIPLTLPLALFTFVLTLGLGLPLGYAMMKHKDSAMQRTLRFISVALMITPNFILAFLLVYALALQWKVFPAGGFTPWSRDPAAAFTALVLPATALGLGQAAVLARFFARECRKEQHQLYSLFFVANGYSQKQIFFAQNLRLALANTMPLIALQLGFLVTGVVVIEQVFYLPGLGALLFDAIAQRDMNLVATLLIFMLTWVVVSQTALMLLQALLDPRLKMTEQASYA